VLVHGDGTVRENGEAGVIEVFLTDNPVLSRRQPGRWLRWLFASLILCVTGLAVFGLATLLTMFSNR